MGRKRYVKSNSVRKELKEINDRMNKAETDISYLSLQTVNIYSKLDDCEIVEGRNKEELKKIKKDKIKKRILIIILIILSISGIKIGILSYLLELL